jgi:hypothetical protein
MALGSTRLREVENDSNGTNIIKRAKKYKRNSPGISSESNLFKNILQNKAIDKLGGDPSRFGRNANFNNRRTTVIF